MVKISITTRKEKLDRYVCFQFCVTSVAKKDNVHRRERPQTNYTGMDSK